MNCLPNNKKLNLFRTTILLGLLLGQALSHQTLAADGPWKLSTALNLPEGFTLSGEYQARFENISDNVQPGTSSNDQIVMLRTTLNAQYSSERFSAQVEIQDARQQKADQDTVLSDVLVSTKDILQANVGVRFGSSGATNLRVGRFTEDWGSRRLMARNRYRNSINTFDGVVLHHQSNNGNQYRMMATEVVRRFPRDKPSLLDNKHAKDESSSAQRFYGAFASLPNLISEFRTEAYWFYLQEKDTADVQTRNRKLHTVGFRLRSTPAINSWDVEIESMIQQGQRRASAATTDTIDLDHQAYSQSLNIAYSFDGPSRLRAIFELNYASGDASPLDDESGRFDSLFGPTTFEFAPVGLYNFFNRSNIVTPGVRLTATPWENVNLMADYRHFWLAESRDSWGRTGIRDVTGDSGKYLGHHLELRVRWSAIPGNVRVDSGVVLLQAKNLSDQNPAFFYLGTKINF